MYKYLIIAVTFFGVGGAGYYFNSSGGGDLLVRAIAESDNKEGVSSEEIFSGTYRCTLESGCTTTTYFVLHSDTMLEINQENMETGELTAVGSGSWGVGQGGAIVFLIDARDSGVTPGFSFVAKKIDILKLSGFSSKIKQYPGIENPTFRRVSVDPAEDEDFREEE